MPFFAKHSDDDFQKLEAQFAECRHSLDIETQSRLAAEGLVAELEDKLKLASAKARGDSLKRRNESEKEISELQATIKLETAKSDAEAAKRLAVENQLRELKNALESEKAQRRADASRLAHEVGRRLDAEKQLAAERSKLDSEINTVVRENTEILSHLHAVQAELEKYFLKNKELESSVGEVTASMRMARHLLMNSNVGPSISSPRLLGRN